MTVPVLFLESESGHSQSVPPETVIETALNLIRTLKALRRENRKISLNSHVRLADCELAPGQSIQNIFTGPKYAEEWLFLKELVLRSPFGSGLDEWNVEIGTTEVQTQSGRTSEALTWAKLFNTGTISLHAQPEWLASWINATCDSLDTNGNITHQSVKIPNASCPDHIVEHQVLLKGLGNDPYPAARTLWEERANRLPGLRFLNRFQNDLIGLSTSGISYNHVLDTLQSLNDDAVRWGGVGEPTFSCKVADGEHDQRRDLSVFHDENAGSDLEFGKHTYFWMGKTTTAPGGRIHFRVATDEKRFVIAYAGHKL